MKGLRGIGAVLAVIVSLTLLCSCGSREEAAAAAESTFNAAMEAFKSGDADKIEQLCESVGSIDDTELRSIILSSLGNIGYTIKSVEAKDSHTAVVNADITMIDASQVMQKYIEGIAAMVSSEEYQSRLATMTKEDYQSLMNNKLSEILSGGSIPNVTRNVSVTVVEKDGAWVVSGGELPELLVTNTLNAIKQIKQ